MIAIEGHVTRLVPHETPQVLSEMNTASELLHRLCEVGNQHLEVAFVEFRSSPLPDQYKSYFDRLAAIGMAGPIPGRIEIPPIVDDNALRVLFSKFQDYAAGAGIAFGSDTPGVWSHDSLHKTAVPNLVEHRRLLEIWWCGSKIGALEVRSIHQTDTFEILAAPTMRIHHVTVGTLTPLTAKNPPILDQNRLAEGANHTLRVEWGFHNARRGSGTEPFTDLFTKLERAGLYSTDENRNFLPDPPYDYAARSMCTLLRRYFAFRGIAPHADTPGPWKQPTAKANQETQVLSFPFYATDRIGMSYAMTLSITHGNGIFCIPEPPKLTVDLVEFKH